MTLWYSLLLGDITWRHETVRAVWVVVVMAKMTT